MGITRGLPAETAKTERGFTLLHSQADRSVTYVLIINSNYSSSQRTWRHHLSHKVHPRLTWSLGSPSVLTGFDLKKNKLLLFMMGGRLSSWARILLQRLGDRALASLMLTFQRVGSQVLERYSWVLKLAKGLYSFLKKLHAFWRDRGKNFYKISEVLVNALSKGSGEKSLP